MENASVAREAVTDTKSSDCSDQSVDVHASRGSSDNHQAALGWLKLTGWFEFFAARGYLKNGIP